ncbi:A disintegrin and metalloproteinase with thrombospondin motifs 7-like, partial [Herpailurus yagouaroundi]|uniref:A disintegrin and metalloproteinase with thrombospondin motifs 7-like n=1 Tax=Herpailurus yagouaroundi TaxID=1608482 RepID=UPI001AD64752
MLVLANPGQEEAAGPPSPRQRRQTRALGWVSWVSRSHTGAQNGPGSGPAFCPDSAVCVQVAGLFHDPSIGNPIHITIVRLVLLEDEEEDLKVTHHADNTLRSFCKWQKSINMKGDAHPLHHDTAILLTRCRQLRPRAPGAPGAGIRDNIAGDHDQDVDARAVHRLPQSGDRSGPLKELSAWFYSRSPSATGVQ